MTKAREVFDRFLQASIDNDWDTLVDQYAPDVVIEIPFAPDPALRRSEGGREALRARFASVANVVRFTGADVHAVHETADPEVIVAEYDLHGELVPTSQAFTRTYAMVITVRDGKIAHSRDYSDPRGIDELLTVARA